MPTSKEVGWRCPTCGRRFVRRPHEHSCDVRSLEAHLERASPAVRETFEALREVLDLEFASSRALSHARIRKSEQYGPTRFSHHARLTAPGDVDASVTRWLKAAYEIGCGRKKITAR